MFPLSNFKMPPFGFGRDGGKGDHYDDTEGYGSAGVVQQIVDR